MVGSSGEEVSNARLTRRLMGLAWNYKASVIRVVLMQSALLAMALAGLGFLGLGVDVIGEEVGLKEPSWPLNSGQWVSDWSTMGKVALIAGAILLVATIRFFFDRINTIWKSLLVQDIVVDLRGQVYDKLQRLSFRFFDANASGTIINRVTGDVQAVRRFIDGVMVEVLILILSLIFFIGAMLSVHVTLTLACIATTPLLWILTTMFSKRVRPAYRKNRELFDGAVLQISENAQGVHVVKGFARQESERQKFESTHRIVRDHKNWIFGQISIFVPLISMLPQINLVVLLIYGGWLYINVETITIGDLVFFSGVLQQFSNQIGNIAQIANAVQQSLTGAQRVFEVMDTPVEIQNPEHPVAIPRAEGRVTFEGVSFGYEDDDEPALQSIDFDIKAGQTVAILGATGAGKSTLLSMIPRFYDPRTGTVRIDGRDVREYELDDLRKNVGLVFQESFLFSNTVAANIAFGHPEATLEQIQQAARLAAAHDFIMEDLSDGYDTVLTEGGQNLSGGQRQRLAIARALLLQPPILLMDDPTAAIDPGTEHEILRAINQAMRGRTTFVVAHRLSTLRRADKVIVMEKGRVVQVGSHSELMDEGGHYRHAADIQTADEESKRLLGMAGGQS